MTVLLTGKSDSYTQFLTVLVIFVLVLGITAFVTRWLANYQKQQNVNSNVEVLETSRIMNNKYVQIIRVGEIYMAVAVCKDTVTMLGEVPKEQLKLEKDPEGNLNFKELFENIRKKNSRTKSEPKEWKKDEEKS